MDTWKVKGGNTTKNAHDVSTDINSCYLGRVRPDSNQRPRRPEGRALNQAELRPAEFKPASEKKPIYTFNILLAISK